jgi:putative hydrolase of the HAD superfamily
MIKAVIFDMFETLVTLFTGKIYFSEDIAADVGADLQEFRKRWHKTEEGRSTGEYTIEEVFETVFKDLGIYSEEKVKQITGNRRECLKTTFDAMPEDSLSLLKELKNRGIKIGLISNTYSDERDAIRQSVLFPYFDVALISYEQGIRKPAPELFTKMTKELGVKPEECLYVGDGGSKELFAARDAGMHPVQCTWFHDLAFEPHVPCPIYDEFDHANTQLEILKFIK